MSLDSIPSAQPWDRPWPEGGLEAVRACPVCGATRRLRLHQGLIDSSFETAAGRWAMWRCQGCGSAYLDPRPTAASIGDAYGSYYTHGQAEAGLQVPARSWMQYTRDALAHGYMRRRYGLSREPSSRWGSLAAALLPTRRASLDHMCRHLRVPAAGCSLLDIGCGDGAFLAIARDCGWRVLGVELDPAAAARAARRGLEVVQGDIGALDGHEGRFDAVTLSHVIEHVHDPLHLLRACHRLLKPGGQLWLETPNIDSCGHRLYGSHWRGLEAPRHLVVFNATSLLAALRLSGFEARLLRTPSSLPWMLRSSRAMAEGQRPGTLVALPLQQRLLLAHDALRHMLGVAGPEREFLTVLGRRGG
jgi:2-polyprenyl-3-methyl-5-hydroxy-6-metoxy-1,4-benzoquinol methylase